MLPSALPAKPRGIWPAPDLSALAGGGLRLAIQVNEVLCDVHTGVERAFGNQAGVAGKAGESNER